MSRSPHSDKHSEDKGQAAVNAIGLKGPLGVKDNPVPVELQKVYPQLGVVAAVKPGKRKASSNSEGSSEASPSGSEFHLYIRPKVLLLLRAHVTPISDD